MAYPPHGQQQPPHGLPPHQPPAVYGPPPGYGQAPQQPTRIQQVGRSVTQPAWTGKQMAVVVFSLGMLWPVVWLYRRSKATVTRHY